MNRPATDTTQSATRDGSATDRVEATEELDNSRLDALTGTYSRGSGMAELERDRSRADRAGEPMTLAFVDIDDLKGTNDRDGHPAGDRLIRQVAELLEEHTRPHDVIIRYGGDEFVCALIGLTRSEAAERLAEINVACRPGRGAGGPRAVAGTREQVRTHPVTFSAGLAVGTDHDWRTRRSIEEALSIARSTSVGVHLHQDVGVAS